MSNRPKAIASGKIFGDRLDVYNLDNGRRVASKRGAVRTLTPKNPEKNGAADKTDLARMLARLPEKFRHLAAPPICEFELSNGTVAHGIDAEHFVDICSAYAEAFEEDLLDSRQYGYARQASAILRALAKVGIVALVDEATGYQQSRAERHLRDLVDRLLSPEPSDWEKFWPDDVVIEICRIYGKAWKGGRWPQWFAPTICYRIYNVVLTPEVADVMREYNEDPKKNRHHQHIAEQAKAGLLREFVWISRTARQAASKRDFWNKMENQYQGSPLQLGFA